jgi:hypothetical protein
MQAVITKYLAPTNHHGSRVKATCDAGSLTIPWDYARDLASNHLLAARCLAGRFNWPSKPSDWVQGSLPASSPHAYCFVRKVA